MVLLVALGGREATEHVRKTKASKIDSRSSTIAAGGALEFVAGMAVFVLG